MSTNPSLPFKILFYLVLINFYLFLAVLGLCCCLGFSLVVASGGYSSSRRPSLSCSVFPCCGARAAGHEDFSSSGSWALEHRLGSCGSWAWLLCNLPRLRMEPMSLALAGGFFTTEMLGKPLIAFF